MKAFKNVTNQGNEPAVKKGTKLPETAVNLGWFSSDEITPEMHLSVSDLSNSIPENCVPVTSSEVDTIMYADEFGVLRYIKNNQEMGQTFGSPIVNNSEVSITNFLMEEKDDDTQYNYTGKINELEEELFVHSFYVSTHFCLLDSNVANYYGIEKSSRLREPSSFGIKVVDESGNNLSDSNGKNKYKIILEKYTNHRSVIDLYGTTYQGLDLYRIIVLLEEANPQNLYLIYNKYEKTETEVPYNPFFGYREKINSIPYYNYVVEESEVVDPSSFNRKIYSTQLFSYKENELLKTTINNDGWKVYAPKKAIQDPRTFQSFNWRLLAKITYNYANVRNVYEESERATLKVAVLYSGDVAQVKNPYVFHNMEESVFNLQNYIFENPLATVANDKSKKNYWLVNMEDATIDYSKFDILVWTPTQNITELQGVAINRALLANASVFVDSSLVSSGLNYLGIDLSTTTTSSGYISIHDSYKNGNTTLNAWDLTEYSETSARPRYSIFGKRTEVLNNNSVISLKTFSGLPSTDSGSVSLVSANSNAVIIKRSINRTQPFSSSLVVSANPFLYLMNDIVGADGSYTSNNGDTNAFPLGTVGSQTAAVSSTVIGPNKLFYNYLSDVNKNKVNNFATNNTTNQSTVLWNVSPWRNWWTINGTINDGKITVISETEKNEYNFSLKAPIGSTEQKFCRQIADSISGILIRDFEGTLNGADAESIINADFSNVEFYVECTNPNVEFLNFTNYNSTLAAGGDTLLGQANSNYKIFKLSTQAFNQIKTTAVSLDAYANVVSEEFDFSSISYPYAIINSSEYHDKTGSLIKTPKDFLPASQDVRDYRFDFKTNISINEITKTANTYRINWSTIFSSVIGGTADFKNVVFKPGNSISGITRSNFSILEVEENKIKIEQKFSPFNEYYYPGKAFSKTDIVSADQETTASSFNNFHYTGDIDAGNRWDEYFVGKDSFGGTTTTTTTATTTPVTTTTKTTTTTKKGTALSNDTIKEEIKKARQSDGTYKTNSFSFLYNGPFTPIGVWGTLVWSGNTAITLSLFFHQWLEKFLDSKFPPKASATQYFAYLGATPASFIADQFIEQNSPIYSASETVTEGGGTTGKVTVAGVSTTTTTTRTTTRNGYSAEFVKYVQYTLSKMGYNIKVNGLYDSSTGSNIRLFQHKVGLGFVDGIVDSQTKSALATYWLYLYKNDVTKYNSHFANAPTGSGKYISAAIKYSDIANIGVSGKEYRRISFTGVPGPTEIEDYIFFKVPAKSNDQILHSVTISTGEWGLKLGEVEVFTSDIDLLKFYQRTKERVSLPGILPSYIAGYGSISKNSSKTISFAAEITGAKWVGIRFYSRKITDAKFGPNAEGFSIKNIEFGISSPSTNIPPVYGGSSDFEGKVQGTISGYTEINSSDESVIDFSTISNTMLGSTITSIYMDKVNFTATQTLGDTTKSITVEKVVPLAERLRYDSTTNKLGDQFSFVYSDIPIVVNGLTQTNSLFDISPSIGTCYKLNGTASPTSVSSSSFSLSQVTGRANQYILKTTLGVLYDSKEVSLPATLSNYYIADADNIASRQNVKNSINVRDGIVVLTDSSGMPTGFPNFSSYIPSSVNSVVNYGFLNILWNYSSPSPYGLEWGFYNVATKKFLGKKISYPEYLNYGPNNVYIGLNAFDADMDRGTADNIVGTTVRMPQSEANRPTRYVCPLYSVKVKNRSKIKVSSPPKTLNKFDTWFVNVGVGKFIKNITIPNDYNFSSTNWMSQYKGKILKCYYDTTQIKVPSSSIFGQGYYDIYDENPDIISDNTIKLRHGSVHAVQEQYDKQTFINNDYTDASPIVPWVFVSIKNAKGKWINIPRKEIKDFDKNTGRITFKKEIVPLSSNDIKVSYTIKNQNLMLHQINGEIIPLNPFLGINNNLPIFIYLLPIRCEELVNGTYSTPTGFQSSGPIMFTTDSAIFDSKSNKYNPLALQIATVNVNNLYDFEKIKVEDMRLKGGGIKHSTNITKEFESNIDLASHADLYTGLSFLHPNGGYVIIQIPQEVMSNFSSKQDVYSIVRNNLTAGVSFDIQDMDGTDWRSIINVE